MSRTLFSRSCAFALLLFLANSVCVAQPSPKLIQSTILGQASRYPFPFAACIDRGSGVIVAVGGFKASTTAPCWVLGDLYVSTDAGRSFTVRDSVQGWYLIAPAGPLYQAKSGEGDILVSHDLGQTWQPSNDLAKHHLNFYDEFSFDGTRSAIEVLSIHGDTDSAYGYPRLYRSLDTGNTWQVIALDTNWRLDPVRNAQTKWADPANGLIYSNDSKTGFLATTSDSGNTWVQRLTAKDWLFQVWGGDQNLDYPFPGCIVKSSSYRVSYDTGRTWLVNNSLPTTIAYPTGRHWIAVLQSGRLGMSSDSARSWKQVQYDGPHRITRVAFSDSLNGVGFDDIALVAKTTDGGYTWLTIDSAYRVQGEILSADQSTYLCATRTVTWQQTWVPSLLVAISRNRGDSWRSLDTVIDAYSIAANPHYVFAAGNGFVERRPLTSGTTKRFDLSRPDTTFVKTTGTSGGVWVWTPHSLYRSLENGDTWSENIATAIPGYSDSTSFEFFPVSDNVVYAQSKDGIFVSQDAQHWDQTFRYPLYSSDAQHWITSVLSKLDYTADGGAHLKSIHYPTPASRPIRMIDSIRWYSDGYFTTDAGTSWSPIPGWDYADSLVAVDAGTAFGQPYSHIGNSYILWRLDLPFSATGRANAGAEQASHLVVYPNPASRVLRLNGSWRGSGHLALTTLGGVEIEAKDVRFSDDLFLPVRELPNGAYILTYTSSGRTTSALVTIEH